MKKISFFKKIRLYKEFKKKINLYLPELEKKFFIRKDKAYRLYTVLNIPEDLIGEAYSLKKSDIDKISQGYISKFLSEISTYLDSIGLSELYKRYKIEKVGKFSYLIVIGFSLFTSNKYYNYLYYLIYPLILLISIICLFIIFQ